MKIISGLVLVMLTTFLMSFEKIETEKEITIQQFDLEASVQRGLGVYQTHCISCHMPKGEGIPMVYPPLSKNDNLKDQAYLVEGVKNGIAGEIVVNGLTYNSAMAKINISDEDLADVLNYVRNSWGNTYDDPITPKKITEITE